MKKTFTLLLTGLLVTIAAHAADREQARQTTALLSSFVTASQSNTPNKALMYRSGRDNPDDTTTTSNLTMTKNSTTIVITRGESLVLTRCSADFGTVEVGQPGPTQIRITTDRAPIRVLCTTNDGSQRVFYTTYQSN